MLRFAAAGRTHTGLVRDHNEDSGFAGPSLVLVADGVGGAAAGEVASATTAYVISAMALGRRDTDLQALLARAVDLAHEQLRVGTEADPARQGMGTTMTAVLTDGTACALAHLGDSRAYLLRGGELHQLTHDHTFVQSLVDDGRLTREQARSHPWKNVVLHALDGTEQPCPDVLALDLVPGDRLLVCSDGLTDMTDDATVAACLEREDRDDAADALVDAALTGGGRDNVTVLVADVEDGPRLAGDGLRLGAFSDPHLVVDPAAVRQ
ncbi:MAG: PP2C family protein-serine/threonine phosphatase [Nocardioides sp.]